VEPGSDLDSARSQLRPQRQGEADAPTGPVEDGQHAVAGALDQLPTLLVDQPPSGLVMACSKSEVFQDASPPTDL
jgi:hypothetical protein